MRPKKGYETGRRENLTPHEWWEKTKKTLANRRLAGKARSEKLRRSLGIKKKGYSSVSQKKKAQKTAKLKTKLRVQKHRERKKSTNQDKCVVHSLKYSLKKRYPFF